MDFFIAFLEGIISFVSPCLLPMLPLYIVYFAGGEEGNRKRTILNASAFILGFSIIFITLGVFSGFIGQFLVKHSVLMNILAGSFVIILGLNYLEVINIKFLNHSGGSNKPVKITGGFSALVFGIVFAISWTPCVGSFLGAALTLAASRATALQGGLMLLCYSLGLGIPFFFSALLIDRLKSTFDFIKRNYKVINKISGGILILLGIFMITGLMNKIMIFLD